MKKWILLFSIFLLLPNLAWGAHYYVDHTLGADTNDGAIGTPWAHAPGMTNCANNCASATLAGDDIVSLKCGESWADTKLTVGFAGTSGHQITLNSYGTGAKPIIAGALNNPAITATAESRGYWTIDGLDLRSTGNPAGIANSTAIYFNYWPSEMGEVPGWIIKNCTFNAAIWASGPSLTVQNNTFDGTGNELNTRGAICIRGPNNSGDIIEGNTISNWIDRGVWVFNGGGTVTVRNNIIHDITGGTSNEGMGINFDGFDVAVTNCKSYGNTIYDCEGIGITHENATGAESYGNTIHDCDMGGIDIISYGDYITSPCNISIHSNVIYNVDRGILIYNSNTFTIANNTIYEGVGANKEGFSLQSLDTNISAITFVNNIIAGSWTHPIYERTNKDIWTLFDYNDIIPAGTEIVYRVSGGSKTLAEIQAEGDMTNGISSDPLFVSAGSNHHILAASPCKNAGTSVSLTRDKDGIPIVGLPDIGAYEYFGTHAGPGTYVIGGSVN